MVPAGFIRHDFVCLWPFAAKCAGMRVNTSRSEAMVLCWKMMHCSLSVGSELLPHLKQFKYLGVLFTTDGKMSVRLTGGLVQHQQYYRN